MNTKGQTLVEVIVALGAAVLILSALTIAVVTGLHNVSQSSAQNAAAQSAETGMEVVQQMRDSDWATLSSLSGSYCLADSCSSLSASAGSCGPKIGSSCGVNVDNLYVREVTLSKDAASCLTTSPVPSAPVSQVKVNVTVSWKDSKCTNASDPYCHKTSLESCLSNFYSKPAP
jgi:hypothetical protein